MAVIGRGRIVFWEGASLWLFAGTTDHAATAAHAHHAIQITFALEGAFNLHAAGETMDGPAVAVAPDIPHVYEASGLAAHIFAEPDGALGRSLQSLWFDGVTMRALPAHELAAPMALLASAFRHNGDDDQLIELGRTLLNAAAEGAGECAPERRVATMIAFIGDNLDDPMSLSTIAGSANLSPSRAAHLFVEQTGLPIKTYILWRRVARAVELYGSGSNLTEAAHAAGFADSAHLSRSFRRMFGLPAATLEVMRGA